MVEQLNDATAIEAIAEAEGALGVMPPAPPRKRSIQLPPRTLQNLIRIAEQQKALQRDAANILASVLDGMGVEGVARSVDFASGMVTVTPD